jgi:hypothetical protein
MQVILYESGDIIDINKICIGDQLMGDDSQPRTVCSVSRKIEKVYKITSTYSNEFYEVSENQILSLKYNTKPRLYRENGKFPRYRVKYAKQICSNNLSKIKISHLNYSITQRGEALAKSESENKLNELLENYEDPTHELTLNEYMKQSKSLNHRLVSRLSEGIEFNFIVEPEIDPYLLGLWLGDGDSNNSLITTIDQEIVNYLYEEATRMNQKINRGKTTEFHKGHLKYKFVPSENKNFFKVFLRENNLLNNKHILDIYKYNTRENRLKLLAGLIDTDGYYANDSCYEILQKNVRLSNDIVYLARSLGYWANIREVKKGCWYKDEYREGVYQKITIGGLRLDEIPVLLPRKKAKKYESAKQKNYLYYKFNIEYIGEKEVTKLEFKEESKLFLLSDFTIIHS